VHIADLCCDCQVDMGTSTAERLARKLNIVRGKKHETKPPPSPSAKFAEELTNVNKVKKEK